MNFIPLYILAGLHCISLGVSIADHGKPRSNENAGLTFISVLIHWICMIWFIISI